MNISTGKGDKGGTSLFWGTKIKKDHIIIESCGVLDEMCCAIGLAKSLIKNKEVKNVLESIQKNLFIIGAEISSNQKYSKKISNHISKNNVYEIEKNINKIESKNKFEEGCFYIPGENFVSSTIDFSRTVTRKAERRLVTLSNKKLLRNKYILAYLNRISDLLYLYARIYDKKSKKLNAGDNK